MPYRTSTAPTGRPPAEIHYGPFDRGWRQVAGTLAVTLLALFIATLGDFAGNGNARLSCNRDTGTCVLDIGYLLLGHGEHHNFRIANVREVTHYGEFGEDDIGIYVGNERLVMHRGSRQQSEEIHSFFFDKASQSRLNVAIRPSLFFLGAFVLIAGFSVATLWGLLRQPSSIKLLVLDGTMAVTLRWCGIPLGTETLPLDNVSEIRVVHTERQTFLQNARPAGWVSLVADDVVRPLTKRPMFGTDVHDQAARDLAAALECKVTTEG